ncbi:copper-binding protein [Pseudoduganella sp. UC29_106]|uniref:copper-binding protein n=1 Tax=Pseudoduganella sp. UC29_106 TaxID=3374553 RepID=UPI00375758E1
MNAFNTTLRAAFFAAVCMSGAPAFAQHGEHDQHMAAAASDTTEGEIKKIDKAASKITLKHGDLKNLGMGGMTMAFRVKDAALLDKARQGDKVRFTVAKVDGALTVTSLEAVK